MAIVVIAIPGGVVQFGIAGIIGNVLAGKRRMRVVG